MSLLLAPGDRKSGSSLLLGDRTASVFLLLGGEKTSSGGPVLPDSPKVLARPRRGGGDCGGTDDCGGGWDMIGKAVVSRITDPTHLASMRLLILRGTRTKVLFRHVDFVLASAKSGSQIVSQNKSVVCSTTISRCNEIWREQLRPRSQNNDDGDFSVVTGDGEKEPFYYSVVLTAV